MPSWEVVKSILVTLGFTPDKLAPLIVLGFIGYVLICKIRINPVKDLLNKVDKSLTALNLVLLEKKYIKNDFYSQSNSPIQLNAMGFRLFKESNAEKIYLNFRDNYIKILEGKGIKTALEAEKESFLFCLNILSEDIKFKEVQDFVYNNPKFPDKESGNNLDLGAVAFVMALQLRNDFLSKHPELLN
jgi:hypothetical protein